MSAEYQTLLIDFLLSMKWLWLIVVILCYNLLRTIVNSLAKRISIESDIAIRDTKYNEEDIVKHLDYIISEALDEYILLNIKPKNIYYINTKTENEIVKHLSEEIPKRISKTLLVHLAFIYDNSYIGQFIGKHIYMTVLNYVLNYNMENANEIDADGIKNNNTS